MIQNRGGFRNINSQRDLETIKSDPPFDYVIHTASPFHYKFTDPVTEVLDPAIKGTTGILKAIKAFAPTVKRVVITSSFAAMLRDGNSVKVYDESVWGNITWDEATGENKLATYRASKVSPLRVCLHSCCVHTPLTLATCCIDNR